MNLGLKGKVAIAAASSKGLGFGAANALAKEGVNLAICAREKEMLEKTAKKIREENNVEVIAIYCDLNQKKDIENLVNKTTETFGKIDILVCNAGGPPTGKFLGIGDELWQKTFELTLMSAVRLSRLVIPHMQKQKMGRIINIVSSSVKQPISNLLLSNSIRSAVVGMAKTLSMEFASENITVNNICPGRFLTDRIKNLYKEKLVDATKDIPMQRLGKVEELGSLVAFLASEKAAYITGTTIQIDGGLINTLL